MLSLAPMQLSLATPAPRSLAPARCVAPIMGFGPSPKELSTDPPIVETLRICKAEQAVRFARLQMGGVEMMQALPGKGPFGYFDPLFLAPESADEVLMWREAELTHCRVAMMAALGFGVQELFHPIFGVEAGVDGPVVRQLDQVLSTENGQLGGSILLMAIFFSEIRRARVGWVEPEIEIRTLRKGYVPGDIGFDPLNYKAKLDETGYLAMQNKELNNGRLAMIGVAGMTAQELVTDAPIFAAA